ncbi:MAG: preprotein translocase subunit SecG [Opitutaceae bacterium]|jgi:preprotein translocase subunit SecG
MSILIAIVTFVLIIISALLILVVLAQKTKDGGMGAALGGGMTESTFGAETGNVLSKATINLSIAFFVLGFALYLGHIYMRKSANASQAALPTIPVTSATVPASKAPGQAVPVAPAPKKP